ncbi:MAG: hypothetical protein WBF87_03785, partial [Mesorhizobium sp.]
MPTRLVKRLIRGGALVAVLALATAALLPSIASTQLVRDSIVQELEDLSGYRVTLDASPELVLWPELGAVLTNVAFYDRADATRPLMTAEHIEADIPAWRALFGTIELEGVVLRGPVLNVKMREGWPALPGSTVKGKLEVAIEAAQSGNNSAQPALGNVRFIDGRVVDAETGETFASAINGVIDWPNTGASASATLSAIWRAEPITLAAQLASPINLAKGTATDARLALTSELASGEFSGSLTPTGQTPKIEGDLKLSTPSLKDALEWVGTTIGPAGRIDAITLSGRADGTLASLKLADARLQFEEYPGTGALEFSLAGGVPAIAGTLDFDRLDFGSIFEAFSGPGPSSEQPPVNLDFTDQLGLDIRLSAAQASGAGVTLSEVAAAVQVRRGFAAFDISDASGFG